MKSETPDAERRDTLPLPRQVTRIVRSLARSSFTKIKSELPERPTAPPLEVPEKAVTQFIRAWRERTAYVPGELLMDPAWAMLLELLQAEIQDRRVSLTRLSKISGVSANSAVRWLNALEGRGLAVRRADPENAGNEFVGLSPEGSSALRRYFHDIVQSNGPFEDPY